jgi:hypothetical protein
VNRVVERVGDRRPQGRMLDERGERFTRSIRVEANRNVHRFETDRRRIDVAITPSANVGLKLQFQPLN